MQVNLPINKSQQRFTFGFKTVIQVYVHLQFIINQLNTCTVLLLLFLRRDTSAIVNLAAFPMGALKFLVVLLQNLIIITIDVIDSKI